MILRMVQCLAARRGAPASEGQCPEASLTREQAVIPKSAPHAESRFVYTCISRAVPNTPALYSATGFLTALPELKCKKVRTTRQLQVHPGPPGPHQRGLAQTQ